MGAVAREYVAGVRAVALLKERLDRDPNFLDPDKLSHRDAILLGTNIEPTYLVRLYAEVEAGLRSYWSDGLGRITRPPASVLIDAMAARRGISVNLVAATHEVREYRNSLMHDDHAQVHQLSLFESKNRLCRYFSHLPRNW